MGADARVYIFDYEAYTREVVPLFLDLLKTGTPPDWLLPFIQYRRKEMNLPSGTDLWRNCDYLDPDLSWRGNYNLEPVTYWGWEQRGCQSTTCPERGHCPLHLDRPDEYPYDILDLFRAMVGIKCLGEDQFVGRSRTVSDYQEALRKFELSQFDPLYRLLALLGKRGLVVGYKWQYNEGINGWLDTAETAELVERLNRMDLPMYEVSFAAMNSFYGPDPEDPPLIYERFKIGRYHCPGYTHEELNLSFVRTVATMAVEQKKGILWGVGLLSADFYLDPMGCLKS